MVTRKTTDQPPQDTKEVVNETEKAIVGSGNWRSAVFSTDGFKYIVGLMLSTAGNVCDFRVWQGPADASTVADMPYRSTPDGGDKYDPAVDPNDKNAWQVAVVGQTAILEILENNGAPADIVVDKILCYVRKQ